MGHAQGEGRMNNPNTGGPAFPVQSIYIEDQETNSQGMTLRDYFAAKAMQAYVAHNKAYDFDDIAAISFRVADAMLKARDA
jgi:hypothetical protein